jgi:hypothetical protein
MSLMQQPGMNIWKQLKMHVNSSHPPPPALEETANAPVEAIADDETLVELADVEPAEVDDTADEDPLPADELETIPLESDAVPDPLAAEGAPPPPPPPGLVSRSSLP